MVNEKELIEAFGNLSEEEQKALWNEAMTSIFEYAVMRFYRGLGSGPALSECADWYKQVTK